MLAVGKRHEDLRLAQAEAQPVPLELEVLDDALAAACRAPGRRIDTLKPGMISSVMQAPPIRSLRSTTSVASPFRAR